MSEEIVPQSTATPELSDPGTEPAVIPEPAPGTPVEGEPQIPEEPGTEPAAAPPQEPEEAKLVQEVKKLRRRAQEAEREAAYLKGVADSNQPKQQAPTKQGEPDANDYEDYDQYIVAKAKFQLLEEQKQTRAREKTEKIDLDYQGRLAEAVAKDPELEEKIRASHNLPVHDSVAVAIKESEVGPQIVGYLASNPQEALRLASLSHTSALREVGKIEARLTMKPEPPPKKQVTQAPSPITPTSGKGGSVKNVENMSVTEHIAYHNDLDRKRGYLK